MSGDEETVNILQKIRNGELDDNESIVALKKISQKLAKEVTYSVSDKTGVICFKGLRKFPICLYKEELATLVEIVETPEFATFLEENHDKLSKLPDKEEAKKK